MPPIRSQKHSATDSNLPNGQAGFVLKIPQIWWLTSDWPSFPHEMIQIYSNDSPRPSLGGSAKTFQEIDAEQGWLGCPMVLPISKNWSLIIVPSVETDVIRIRAWNITVKPVVKPSQIARFINCVDFSNEKSKLQGFRRQISAPMVSLVFRCVSYWMLTHPQLYNDVVVVRGSSILKVVLLTAIDPTAVGFLMVSARSLCG